MVIWLMVLQLWAVADSAIVLPLLFTGREFYPCSHLTGTRIFHVRLKLLLLVTTAGGKKPSTMLGGRHENRVRNGF